MRVIYRDGCPVCGGPISSERLSKGLPCERCLPEELPRSELRRLELGGPLGEYLKIEREVEEAERVFHEVTKSVFWSAQRAWFVRALRGESFSIVAPTGMGKSTFGALISVWFGKKFGKSYVVLPTTPLVEMMFKKAKPFADYLGVKVVMIHSKMSKSERREALERLEEGDFNVLITTSRFMMNKLDDLKKFEWSLVFVDDVDSVLKSNKNVDRILMLLGLDEEDVRELWSLVNKEKRLMRYLVNTNDPQKRLAFLRELEEIGKEVERLREKVRGTLIFSSATGKVRTNRIAMIRRLLNFEPGGSSEGIRNVVDSYSQRDYVEVVEALGKGGLVFVPSDKGLAMAEEVAERLKARGIRAEVVSSENVKAIEAFERGEVEVLVGVATHYGVLTRGIDPPHVIRYAVFVGVPRLKFKLKLDEPSPRAIVNLLRIAVEVGFQEYAKLYREILKKYRSLSPQALEALKERLSRGEVESETERLFVEAYEAVKELASRDEFVERVRGSGYYEVVSEGDELYLLIPDAATYLQASGRTSRLYAGGVTKGLSVVIVDSEPLFKGLRRRLAWVIENWYPFEQLDLAALLKEIDEDRRKVLKVLRGELSTSEIRKLLKTSLLIVESPNKARTIKSFFGRPSVRTVRGVRVYEVGLGNRILYVTASGGHTNDLVSESDPLCPTKEKDCLFYGIEKTGIQHLISIKRCMVCGTQFSENSKRCIRCGSKYLKDSREVIEGLRLLAEEVDEVLVGTDPDTEGEKIGWDVANLVKPFARKVLRVEFHEVTKRALLNAIDNPREFDLNLVGSQMLRRAEDRLIGFTLSPKLWFDFWPKYSDSRESCKISRNLSAGRVQTPVLGWVIERYEEYKRSRKKFYIVSYGEGWRETFPEDAFRLKPSKKDVLRSTVVVKRLREWLEEVPPRPPFTTDTLLEEANEALRLSADQTMKLAQDLFELGFITYHRTDSTRVSDVGIGVAREWIAQNFGEDAFKPRRWGAGGAHEAIRPTRPIEASELKLMIEEGTIATAKPLTNKHLQLYDLIFRRFMASQMRETKVKKVTLEISLEELEAKIEKELVSEIVEPGWVSVYPRIEVGSVPPEGRYEVKEVTVKSWNTVPLYSQADLIKLMKERGLGRPSTYAKIVSTLIERRYVIESPRQRKLIPTKKGIGVYAYLNEKYSSLVSEERTRKLEELMDLISEGKASYDESVRPLIEEVREIPIEGSPLGDLL